MMDTLHEGLFQHLILPFLDLRTLLELKCVSSNFNAIVTNQLKSSNDSFFCSACKLLCHNDLSTFAGLVYVTRKSQKEEGLRTVRRHRGRIENKYFSLDEWTNKEDEDNDNALAHFKLPSWRAACVRILDRIQSIEERKKMIQLNNSEDLNTTGFMDSSIFIRTLNQLLGFSPIGRVQPQPQKVSALFVASDYRAMDVFYHLCAEKGVPRDDIDKMTPCTGWNSYHADIPLQHESQNIECSMNAMEYGPAGSEAMCLWDFSVFYSLSRFRHDFLIWSIHVGACEDSKSETPWGFPNLWKANRIALRDFILAKECHCKTLLILAIVDDSSNDQEMLSISEDVVKEHLRLSVLSEFGIECHVQQCCVEQTNGQVRFQGAEDGLQWATSKLQGTSSIVS